MYFVMLQGCCPITCILWGGIPTELRDCEGAGLAEAEEQHRHTALTHSTAQQRQEEHTAGSSDTDAGILYDRLNQWEG